MGHVLSRRAVLQKCLALGGLVLATPLSADAAIDLIQVNESATCRPTPPDALGPFYKKSAPEKRNLRSPGDAGLALSVKGHVYDVHGSPLKGATVEIWQADSFGYYDIQGYRFRTKLWAGARGEYSIETVMPGHYPDRVAQHVHYLIASPGHKPLVTQLYFATDPAFEGDPARNFARDPLITSVELIRPVVLTGDPKEVTASVVFDLCLEPLT